MAPPGWPTPPLGFTPPPGWQPDPAWPSPPSSWSFWQPEPVAPTDRILGLTAIAGSAVCAIGSWLIWTTVVDRPDSTSRFVLQRLRGPRYLSFTPHLAPGIGPGFVTGMLALVALAVLLVRWLVRSSELPAAVLAVCAGGAAAAVVIRTAADLHRHAGGAISFHPAGGLWVTLAGSGLMLTAGLVQVGRAFARNGWRAAGPIEPSALEAKG